MGTKLRDLEVGHIIYFMLNGNREPYRVRKKGVPDPAYYDSTWENTVYLTSENLIGPIANFLPAGSDYSIFKYSQYYLNGPWQYICRKLERSIDSAYIRSKIKTVNLPIFSQYKDKSKPSTYNILDQGTQSRVFYPSISEIGYSQSAGDGSPLNPQDSVSNGYKTGWNITPHKGLADNETVYYFTRTYSQGASNSSTSNGSYLHCANVRKSASSENADVDFSDGTNIASASKLNSIYSLMAFAMEDDVEVDENNDVIIKNDWISLKSSPYDTQVKIQFDDGDRWFYVKQKGNPDPSWYGEEFNDGVWLVAQSTPSLDSNNKTKHYQSATFEGFGTDSFSKNEHQNFVYNQYEHITDQAIKAKVKEVKIPYATNRGSTYVQKRENGAPCKTFSLSTVELGFWNSSNIYHIGARLKGYKPAPSSSDNYGRLYSTILYGNEQDGFSAAVNPVMYFCREWGNYVSGWSSYVTSYNGYTYSPYVGTSSQFCNIYALVVPENVGIEDSGGLKISPSMSFSINSESFGAVTAEPDIRYSLSIPDNSLLTSLEKCDGVLQKQREFNTPVEQKVDWLNPAYFLRIPNETDHVVEVEAKSIYDETLTLQTTFTKVLHECVISHKTGFESSTLAQVAALRLIGDIPADARIKIELTNNYKDAAPVWEDGTSLLLSGDNFVLANTTATAGNWYNFRVTLARGISDTPGKLYGIAGTFQGAE